MTNPITWLSQNGGQIVIYLVSLLMAVVLAYQMIKGIPLNDIAITVTFAALGITGYSNGVQKGVDSTNSTVQKVAAAVPAATKGETGETGETGATGATGKTGATGATGAPPTGPTLLVQ
jgi:hypothetical protein